MFLDAKWVAFMLQNYSQLWQLATSQTNTPDSNSNVKHSNELKPKHTSHFLNTSFSIHRTLHKVSIWFDQTFPENLNLFSTP